MEKLIENNKIKTSERHGGIDLFRVISMFMVVLLHVNGIGGIIKNTTPLSPLWFLSSGINVVCVIAVNCFALISGYVNVGKRTKLKNILMLWIEAFFYSVIFYILEIVCNTRAFSFSILIRMLLPVTFERWWYFSAYFLLFLLMPLFNLAIEKFNKVSMAWSIAAVGVAFCVMEYISKSIGLEEGYNFIWVAYLYFVGAFIKKYGICIKIKGKPVKAWVYFIGFLTSTILHYGTSLLYSYLHNWALVPVNYEYNFILNAISAVFLLLFFANIKVKSNKFLTTLSATTFGVYLTHLAIPGGIMSRFTFLLNYHWAVTLLLVFAVSISFYITCTILDYLRIWLFKLIKIPNLCDNIQNFAIKIYKKLLDKFDKQSALSDEERENISQTALSSDNSIEKQTTAIEENTQGKEKS